MVLCRLNQQDLSSPFALVGQRAVLGLVAEEGVLAISPGLVFLKVWFRDRPSAQYFLQMQILRTPPKLLIQEGDKNMNF